MKERPRRYKGYGTKDSLLPLWERKEQEGGGRSMKPEGNGGWRPSEPKTTSR